MSDIALSLQYLSACSEESLEAFELSRLNRASNLRKELSQVAEEWVDAEVSSRLARIIVDRRRAGPDTARPQSPLALSLTSRSQLTLRLPFPCEPAVVDAGIESVATPSSGSQMQANYDKSEFAHSSERSSGAKRKIPATKVESRSTLRGAPRTSTNLFATASSIEPARTASAATSIQAATELRALHAIASGPPEMHPNPPGVTSTSPLRFRFGFRAEPLTLP